MRLILGTVEGKQWPALATVYRLLGALNLHYRSGITSRVSYLLRGHGQRGSFWDVGQYHRPHTDNPARLRVPHTPLWSSRRFAEYVSNVFFLRFRGLSYPQSGLCSASTLLCGSLYMTVVNRLCCVSSYETAWSGANSCSWCSAADLRSLAQVVWVVIYSRCQCLLSGVGQPPDVSASRGLFVPNYNTSGDF